MKVTSVLVILAGFFLTFPTKLYSQMANPNQVKMKTNQTIEKSTLTQQVLIDKFIVPENAGREFFERMNINRNIIKNLPGFVEDKVYQRVDEQGNLIIVTLAVWENEASINKAKETVQAEYRKQNFNMPDMLKRLNITIDRGIYERTEQ